MGKKAIRILLFTLLFGAMLHISAWAESAVVISSDVNMREGPGTNFRVVDCLPEGAKVTVLDRSNGPWFRVEYDGTTGFMAAGFLEITEEESPLLTVQVPTQSTDQSVNQNVNQNANQSISQSIPQSINQSTSLSPAQTAAQSVVGQGQAGYVDAMYVRFRSAPGSDYSVRGEYNRGKELTYYFTIGDWAACIIDGVPGYIYKDYVALGSFDGWTETPAAQTDVSTAISDMPVIRRMIADSGPIFLDCSMEFSRSSIVNLPSISRFAVSSAFFMSISSCAFSTKETTSPMPRILCARRSGWKVSRSEIFSPTPVNLIGTPVTALTESAAPPLESPSNFVRIRPVTARRSLNAFATLTIS